MSGLPSPAPPTNPETRAFWDATDEGRLLVPVCGPCDRAFWYPRLRCPECGSEDVTWTPSSGRGVVHTFSVIRRGAAGPYRDVEALVVAYVELDEGVRIVTNILGDPDDLAIGDEVEVEFDRTDGPGSLYRFRRVDASAS